MRPTDLTMEVGNIILESLRNGSYFETACEAAGVAASTGYLWMKKGREHQCPEPVTPAKGKKGSKEVVVIPECPRPFEHVYVEFSEAVSRVDALVEREAVGGVLSAGAADWRAAAWFLERRHAARWRNKSEQKVVGPDGGPVVFEFKVVRDETPPRAVPGSEREQVA